MCVCVCVWFPVAGMVGGGFCCRGRVEGDKDSVSGKCTWIASHQLPICCEAAVTGRVSGEGCGRAGQQQTERKTISGANNPERHR